MMETGGPAPKNNRNVIIAIVAAVVLCCCCSIGALAWSGWNNNFWGLLG